MSPAPGIAVQRPMFNIWRTQYWLFSLKNFPLFNTESECWIQIYKSTGSPLVKGEMRVFQVGVFLRFLRLFFVEIAKVATFPKTSNRFFPMLNLWTLANFYINRSRRDGMCDSSHSRGGGLLYLSLLKNRWKKRVVNIFFKKIAIDRQ